MDNIPVALDESIMMDGGSYITVFKNIIFPLMLPATATIAIMSGVWVINDMYIPYLYMPDKKYVTLTTSLMNYSNTMHSDYQKLSAAIILVALPAVMIYLFFQKYIFAGIVFGAIKE